jgi:hypothetical protein
MLIKKIISYLITQPMSLLNVYQLRFAFGMFGIWLLAWQLAILTEISCGFSLSKQKLVHNLKIGQERFLPNSSFSFSFILQVLL